MFRKFANLIQKDVIFDGIYSQKITKHNVTKQCTIVLLWVILSNYTWVVHGSESTLLLGNCTTTPFRARPHKHKQQVSTMSITPLITIMLHVYTYTYTDVQDDISQLELYVILIVLFLLEVICNH